VIIIVAVWDYWQFIIAYIDLKSQIGACHILSVCCQSRPQSFKFFILQLQENTNKN
jgi:hypothetical protein